MNRWMYDTGGIGSIDNMEVGGIGSVVQAV